MKIKALLSDFWDNIIYYIYDKPKDIYRTIKHWFYCNWNIYHWRYVKYAFTSHPWDYSFGLEAEELFIDKQIHWFEHHQMMIDEQYEQIMRSLRWAKYCIHIMNNETDLYHYTGDIKWGEPEPVNDSSQLSTSEVNLDELKYHYDGPKLNWRTAKRFLNDYQIKAFKQQEHEYYLIKVKHLYYRIREQYTEYWWD